MSGISSGEEQAQPGAVVAQPMKVVSIVSEGLELSATTIAYEGSILRRKEARESFNQISG